MRRFTWKLTLTNFAAAFDPETAENYWLDYARLCEIMLDYVRLC